MVLARSVLVPVTSSRLRAASMRTMPGLAAKLSSARIIDVAEM